MPAGTKRKPAATRARSEEQRQAKLDAILAAALDVFAEKGFSDARLDDVAARAGVAKGTIYLYVTSKEALFEALVHTGIAVPIETIEEKVLALDLPAEATLRMLFTFLREEVLGTRRREIVRLILSEGGRFPEIAAVYHREVLSRGMRLLRRIASRRIVQGVFRFEQLARFPQLAVAHGILATIWTSLVKPLEDLEQ